MNPTPHVLADTSLSFWGTANGGYRRTLQIDDLLRTAGMEVESVGPSAELTRWHYYCKGIRFLCQTGFRGKCQPGLLRDYGKAVARLGSAFRTYRGDKVLLWEVTRRNNLAVPFFARKSGFSVIALPHNLESLAPDATMERREMIRPPFDAEIRALKAADRLFTISREEQWLLSLHKLAPLFLPYFPTGKIAGELLELRSRRRLTRGNRLLMLGTAWNTSTLEGMIELVKILRDLPGGSDLPIDIAGFGAEKLLGRLEGTACRLHGKLDDAALEGLLQNARAVLVHQRAGTGALTRISEMLLAGLPVIANGIAARSHGRLDGLHVYDTPAELSALLQCPLPEPEAPRRPVGAEQQFVEEIRRRVAAYRHLPPL